MELSKLKLRDLDSVKKLNNVLRKINESINEELFDVQDRYFDLPLSEIKFPKSDSYLTQREIRLLKEKNVYEPYYRELIHVCQLVEEELKAKLTELENQNSKKLRVKVLIEDSDIPSNDYATTITVTDILDDEFLEAQICDKDKILDLLTQNLELKKLQTAEYFHNHIINRTDITYNCDISSGEIRVSEFPNVIFYYEGFSIYKDEMYKNPEAIRLAEYSANEFFVGYQIDMLSTANHLLKQRLPKIVSKDLSESNYQSAISQVLIAVKAEIQSKERKGMHIDSFKFNSNDIEARLDESLEELFGTYAKDVIEVIDDIGAEIDNEI